MARYENSVVKLILKTCQTFAENYFIKLTFPKIWHFFDVSAGQSAILTEPKEICQLINYEKLESPKMTHPNNRP